LTGVDVEGFPIAVRGEPRARWDQAKFHGHRFVPLSLWKFKRILA
jgi:hypothetical protein